MDAGLLAWSRAVKRRQRSKFPVLWLFTDALRLPDPLPAIAALPPRLCGVVFRHDGVENRAELAGQVAALCRRRGIALVLAGDVRLAARLKAGVHLRAGRWPHWARPAGHPSGLLTSSAHNFVELRRASLAGAGIVFLSNAFLTVSHPGKAAFGAVKWANIARKSSGGKPYALGGISGESAQSLPRFCRGVGAITPLIP